MIFFSENMKMAEIIHSNYLLIPVIRRFGIRLGFGDKTVHTLCHELQIDANFLLTIINTFSNKDYFPEKRLLKVNTLQFIHYLQKTHDYYLNYQVPIIEKHIQALINSSPDNSNSLSLVQNFFKDYKNELEEHLNREENITFPYIKGLYKLYHNDFNEKEYDQLSHSYSMKKYAEEHNNIDDKLYDLQNILIKYLSGSFDDEHTQAVLFELFRLEKDIRNHTRLEERILKPMVEEMELALKSLIC